MTKQRTKAQEHKLRKRARRSEQDLVTKTPRPDSHAEGRARQQLKLAAIGYFNARNGTDKKAQRGRYANRLKLDGRGVQQMHPRVVNVSFDVTQEVAAALRALCDTGLFGNGVDCASIAEELLRKALLDPQILPFWRKS